MTAQAAEPVLYGVDAHGVAAIAFNRPEVNNAYDGTLIEALHKAMDALGARADVRAVVLRGNGRHFQAGADLRWIRGVAAQGEAENEHASRATADAIRRLNRLPVPTVALVQGACFGGGTGIVAACDVVVATNDAMFSIAETRWGLTAAIILPQLADAIGVRQVRRYALTGERFSAQEARRIGLVHEVVAPAELEAAGSRLIEQLVQSAPGANAETKRLALELAFGDPGDAAFERLVRLHAAKRRSAEAAEGLASFVEKRAARWAPGQPD